MVTTDAREELFKETIKFLNEIKDIRLKGLYLHLIVEGYVNQIIKKNFKHIKKILNKERPYSFNQKIEILHGLGIIDDIALHNLKKVNNARNVLAHRLYFGHSEIEEELEKIKFPKEIKLPFNNQENRADVLIELAFKEIYRELKDKIPE
jgi:uncharacterized protein YutE (UPF0331/DUF86 family)